VLRRFVGRVAFVSKCSWAQEEYAELPAAHRNIQED